MPPLIETPSIDYANFAPELILVVGALLLLTGGTFLRRRRVGSAYAIFTVLTAVAALVSTAFLWHRVSGGHGHAVLGVADAIVVDGYSVFFAVIICAAVVLGALLSDDYLRREGLEGPEFYVLMLLSASGGLLMAAANDLIVVFLGLEILSIALYVMAGYHRRRAQSQEAAIKYFVLGAFSSAFFLYGVALTYGATGSTNLGAIATFLRANTLTEGVFL
ncbi:MAG TPA: proton-conducting transporter membrane subunit, partial [Acidimicrobiales bacterium]|nr:proton-conducting transporter membrane subunit [Acidimicrobiales bacterium]